MNRLYVARDGNVHVVSRARLRMADARPVAHSWPGLVETTARTLHAQERSSPSDAALVALPPLLAGSATLLFAPVEIGLAVAGGVFFVMAYAMPMMRRRRASPRRRPGPGPRSDGGQVRMLTAAAERTAFDRAVGVADRITETWPALGALVNPAEADEMLVEALWGIAGVLVRRQELSAVLTRLSRPEFADAPADDQTAVELRGHVRAAKEALSAVEIDLATRMASLRRAEEAGRAFIRDQQMREAIRAAEESLGSASAVIEAAADPGAELADQTQRVLAAYRELTRSPHPDPTD